MMVVSYGTNGPRTFPWGSTVKLLVGSALLAAALYLVYTNAYEKGYLDGVLHERTRLAPQPTPIRELAQPRPATTYPSSSRRGGGAMRAGVRDRAKVGAGIAAGEGNWVKKRFFTSE